MESDFCKTTKSQQKHLVELMDNCIVSTKYLPARCVKIQEDDYFQYSNCMPHLLISLEYPNAIELNHKVMWP